MFKFPPPAAVGLQPGYMTPPKVHRGLPLTLSRVPPVSQHIEGEGTPAQKGPLRSNWTGMSTPSKSTVWQGSLRVAPAGSPETTQTWYVPKTEGVSPTKPLLSVSPQIWTLLSLAS